MATQEQLIRIAEVLEDFGRRGMECCQILPAMMETGLPFKRGSYYHKTREEMLVSARELYTYVKTLNEERPLAALIRVEGDLAVARECCRVCLRKARRAVRRRDCRAGRGQPGTGLFRSDRFHRP